MRICNLSPQTSDTCRKLLGFPPQENHKKFSVCCTYFYENLQFMGTKPATGRKLLVSPPSPLVKPL